LLVEPTREINTYCRIPRHKAPQKRSPLGSGKFPSAKNREFRHPVSDSAGQHQQGNHKKQIRDKVERASSPWKDPLLQTSSFSCD
jgi:hypothetical protein